VLLCEFAQLGRRFRVFIAVARGFLAKEGRRYRVAAQVCLSLEEVPHDEPQELLCDFGVFVPKGQ
jgi:hypothetical protein